MDDMKRLVGRNVRRARLAKRMTQDDLAAATGATQHYVSGLENGERNPTIVSIFHLAQALGVTPVDLVSPDGGPDPEPTAAGATPGRGRPRRKGG